MNDPAFLELFSRLRAVGLPLGLEEYHHFLKAVDAGYGGSTKADLKRLCQTMWIKSAEENQVFLEYFEQLITDPHPLEQVHIDEREKRLNFPNRFIIAAILGLLIVILVIGFVFLRRDGTPQDFAEISFQTDTFFIVEGGTATIAIHRQGNRNMEVGVHVAVLEGFAYIDWNKPDFDERWNKKENYFDIRFEGDIIEQKIAIPLIEDDTINNENRIILLKLENSYDDVELSKPSEVTIIVFDDEAPLPDWLLYILIFLLILCLGLVILGTLLFILIIFRSVNLRRKLSETKSPKYENPNLPRARLSPEVIQKMDNEIEAYKSFTLPDKNNADQLFYDSMNLPITPRQMKQSWRYLRNYVRQGVPNVLDLEATIKQIGQNGFLLKPVLVPERVNKLELLLFIDLDGSMIPFHHLGHELVNSAVRGGRFNQVKVFYFHNFPDDYVYRDTYRIEGESLDELLVRMTDSENTVCLIFSDAGAARGGYSSRRRRLTKRFVRELQTKFKHVAWLNPVPRERWIETTASEIAKLIPMFVINHREFSALLHSLRKL